MKILKVIGILIISLVFLSIDLCYGQTFEAAIELIKKGKEYGSQGKLKEAKEAFEKGHEYKFLLYQYHQALDAARHLKIIEYVDQKKIEPSLVVHYFKAINKLKSEWGRWDQAIAYFNKIVDQNPENPGAYFIRGYMYRNSVPRNLTYPKAISDYSKTISLNPHFSDAYIGRGIIYFREGQYDEAISDYSKAIELNPGDSGFYLVRGDAYRSKQEYDNAISDYSKAIEINPEYSDAYLRRGNVHFLKGQYRKSLSDFYKIMEINPKYSDVDVIERVIDQISIGTWKIEDRYDNAISFYSKAIELDPDDPRYYLARGYAYGRKGWDSVLKKDHSVAAEQYDNAISDYNKAIKLNPVNPTFYGMRATFVYTEKEQYKEAISDYTKAIELKPEDAFYYKLRGHIYAYIVYKYDKAISDYSKVIELEPEDTSSYANRGALYKMLGDVKEMNWYEKAISGAIQGFSYRIPFRPYGILEPEYVKAISRAARGAFYKMFPQVKEMNWYEKAVSDYNKVIELDPENYNYYTSRGEAYAGMSKYKQAIDDYSNAIEFCTRGGYVLWSLIDNRADFYARIGKYEEAIADYSKIIEMSPRYASAYSNRGDIYDEIGNLEKACSDWRKSFDLGDRERWSIVNRIRCLGK